MYLSIAQLTAAERGVNAIGGLVAVVITLFVIVLAISWIILPFVLSSKLSELTKVTRQQTDVIKQMSAKLDPISPPRP